MRLITPANLLTLGNLLCGALAASVALTTGNLALPFWLIVAGAVFDFFDGFVARLLHQASPIGLQLDSLADVVTFGLAPAAMLCAASDAAGPAWWLTMPWWMSYMPLALVAFTALRLARFNVDPEQATEFTGLPSPAGGLLVANMALIGLHSEAALALALGVGLLLTSPVRMFSLKFHGFAWAENKLRYSFMILSAVLIVCLWRYALPTVILLYILLSTVRWCRRKVLDARCEDSF